MTRIFQQVSDVFQNQPVTMLQLLVCVTALALLGYDFYSNRNNHLSKQIELRIGTEKRKLKGPAALFDEFYSRFRTKFKKVESSAELQLQQANLNFTPKEYSLFLMIGMGAGVIIGFVFFPFSGVFKGMVFFIQDGFLKTTVARLVASVILGVAGSYFPRFWVKHLARKRIKELNNQTPDALLSIADGLQSSLTPNQTIKAVSEDLPSPMGDEFKICHQDMEMGKTFNEALDGLKDRVGVPDFTMAAIAMQIQNDAGGKLQDLLRGMVRILQERADTRAEIKKTIQNQKMVGIILLCAPFFFLFAFSAANEDTYRMMFSSVLGWVLMIVAAVAYAIAAWFIAGIIQYVNKGV